ncbi:Flp pilus assembly protein CpaB [Kocuria rosea]|uniref:Flp pilus assembly protein CpaB n=1 Tax=Kocuria rosea TaxID=1275 RepID=UPI000D64ECE6|nr:RcpC/CpaB family pilus assembly protein [Kocuria rosea]PWF87553.1 Flp pilus assembly protein CpaB [Kocuria rosea]STX02879.1 Flp pilus assembly protein CpaB [Kocuria rosea]
MKIRIIAGAVMALLALAGLAIISTYVGTADARALDDQEPREVYLVTAPILEGTPVEEFGESVTLHTVPAAIVPEGAVTELGKHSGSVAGVDLQPGEQLLDSRLVDPQALEEPGTVPVPDGLQEVTIQLDAPRVVGGQLAAGDTVGFFVSFEGEEGRESKTAKDLHKVLVTSVQGAPSAAAPAEGAEMTGSETPAVPEGSMLVTFAVNADTAEKIVYASEFGRIWLSLEPEDAEENDNGATRSDFE